MAGGFAGTFSWLISFPIDVVKSRLQVDGIDGKAKYSGAIDCMKKSYRSEGLAFFTRGLNSTLIRAFPMNAVCFLVVSYVMKFFDNSKTIDVTIAPPERFAIHEPHFFMIPFHVENKFQKDTLKLRYLVSLDGFHEASCHAEMMNLSDGLREKRETTAYFYKMNDGITIENLSMDQMKTPLT